MGDNVAGFVLGVMVVAATVLLGLAGVIGKDDVPVLLMAVLPGAGAAMAVKRKRRE